MGLQNSCRLSGVSQEAGTVACASALRWEIFQQLSLGLSLYLVSCFFFFFSKRGLFFFQPFLIKQKWMFVATAKGGEGRPGKSRCPSLTISAVCVLRETAYMSHQAPIISSTWNRRRCRLSFSPSFAEKVCWFFLNVCTLKPLLAPQWNLTLCFSKMNSVTYPISIEIIVKQIA